MNVRRFRGLREKFELDLQHIPSQSFDFYGSVDMSPEKSEAELSISSINTSRW